jgi:hypothetical protein
VDLGVESIRFRDLIASFINELSEDTVVNTQKETQFSADVNNFIMNCKYLIIRSRKNHSHLHSYWISIQMG